MNASRRAASSRVLAEYSKSIMRSEAVLPSRKKAARPAPSAAGQKLLDLSPAALGHVARRATGFQRVRARRGTVAGPSHDSLGDARGAKHVVRDVELPFGGLDRAAPDAATILGDVLGLAREAERREVEAQHAPERPARDAPAHAVIGEIGERMAQRGELPVEHREDPCLVRVEDEVVE